jgi:hypothetical protein
MWLRDSCSNYLRARSYSRWARGIEVAEDEEEASSDDDERTEFGEEI